MNWTAVTALTWAASGLSCFAVVYPRVSAKAWEGVEKNDIESPLSHLAMFRAIMVVGGIASMILGPFNWFYAFEYGPIERN